MCLVVVFFFIKCNFINDYNLFFWYESDDTDTEYDLLL